MEIGRSVEAALAALTALDVKRRNVEAAIDGIIEAHSVEHGESCDCPIGLAVEEYETVAAGTGCPR